MGNFVDCLDNRKPTKDDNFTLMENAQKMTKIKENSSSLNLVDPEMPKWQVDMLENYTPSQSLRLSNISEDTTHPSPGVKPPLPPKPVINPHTAKIIAQLLSPLKKDPGFNYELRMLKEEHAFELFTLYNDPYSKVLSGDDNISFELVREWCTMKSDNIKVDGIQLGIFDEERIIGNIQIYPFSDDDKNDFKKVINTDFTDTLCIGYILHRDYWNKRIMTRMVKDVIHYCFKTIGIKCLVGMALSQNIPSRRVMEKNNFLFLGEELSNRERHLAHQPFRSFYLLMNH